MRICRRQAERCNDENKRLRKKQPERAVFCCWVTKDLKPTASVNLSYFLKATLLENRFKVLKSLTEVEFLTSNGLGHLEIVPSRFVGVVTDNFLATARKFRLPHGTIY